MGRGSMYHGYGDRYTMGTGFDIPWVGGRYIMDRVDIPWVEGSIYHE
jgi:hypothetical protein